MKRNLKKMRADAIQYIHDFMVSAHLTTLLASDIDEGSSPIVQEDCFDDDDNMTLDSISINSNGKLVFSASNCWGNADFDENTISTDALLEINEWIEDNKDDAETEEGEDSPAKEKTLASFDVTFEPMVNVKVKVADPEHPTQEEIDTILEAASRQLFGNTEHTENITKLELYATGEDLSPLEEKKEIDIFG